MSILTRSRWWLIAGIVFFVLLPICTIVAIPMLFGGIMAKGSSWLPVLIGIGGPVLGAFFFATAIELKDPPEPPLEGSRLVRRVVLTSAAFAAWPLAALVWYIIATPR